MRHQLIKTMRELRDIGGYGNSSIGVPMVSNNKPACRYTFRIGKNPSGRRENFFAKRFAALFEKRQTAALRCLERRLINIQDQCL